MAHSIFSRTSHTLLLVTRSYFARIDLTGRRKLSVKRIWSEQHCNVDSLTTLLAHAADLGPKPLGRLTVLHSEFWTEILQLPADVASIATSQEIRNALAIEAEIESGISAFESHVTCLPLKGLDTISLPFCTTLIERSRVEELGRFAKKHRAKLHCLVHPATIGLTNDTTSREAAVELNRWTDDALETAASLERLAQNASGSLDLLQRSSPLLVSESKRSKQLAMTVGLAVLSLSSCISWNLHTRQQILAINGTIESLEQLEKQQGRRTTEIKNAESKLVTLAQDTQSANATRRSIETQLQSATEMERLQNCRWTELLSAISKHAADCWVQEIQSDVQKTTIYGLAVSNAEANEFASSLEQTLKIAGWVVSPAATKLTDSDLYQFSIVVKPTNAVPKTNTRSNEIVSNDASITLVKESFP